MTTLIFVMFVLVWLELTQHLFCYGVCYCEFPLYNEQGGWGGKSPQNLKIKYEIWLGHTCNPKPFISCKPYTFR